MADSVYKWALRKECNIRGSLFVLNLQVSVTVDDNLVVRTHSKSFVGSWRYLWDEQECKQVLFAHMPELTEESLQFQYELRT